MGINVLSMCYQAGLEASLVFHVTKVKGERETPRKMEAEYPALMVGSVTRASCYIPATSLWNSFLVPGPGPELCYGE